MNPRKGGIWNFFKFLVFHDTRSGIKFLDCSDEEEKSDAAANHWLVILISIIVIRILALVDKPLKFIGFWVDFFLNLLSKNGGFLGLLVNFLRWKVVIARRDSETFISTIGHLDGRIDLHTGDNLVKQIDDSISAERSINVELGSRALMDLSIMASCWS